MTRRPEDELLAFGVEEGGRADLERRSLPLDDGRERGIEIAFRIGTHDNELYAQGDRRLLHVAQLVFGIRIIWIDEHRDGRGLGNHLMQQAQPLRLQPRGKMIDAGDVTAGPIEAGDEVQPDGIGAGAEDNGSCRGRRLSREHGRSTSARDDHAHLPADQIGRQCRQSVVLTFRPTVFDRHILPFDITRFFQTLAERRDLLAERSSRCGIKEADHRHRRLLRARRERPRRRAAEQGDEVAAFHSRTSLARAINTSDKETPSEAAVFRLTPM